MTVTKSLVSLVAASAFLAACAADSQPQKQTIGTVAGGVIGGILGSNVGQGKGQTAGIIGGAVLGALLGGSIGKSLDEADRSMAERTAQTSLERNPSGQSSSWSNPDSGHSGSVTPTRTYRTASGQDCREYETSVTIDGKRETAYGTACRQPDGTWQMQN